MRKLLGAVVALILLITLIPVSNVSGKQITEEPIESVMESTEYYLQNL